MSQQILNLDANLYTYLQQHSLRESPLLQQLREETQGLEMARMQIAPEQGQFMALLVELSGAQKIIEIGTFTGYSALAMAQALPEQGQLICCDVSREWTDIAQRYWSEAGVHERIDLRLGPALDTLQSLLEQGAQGQFDMAFIDADKTNYLAYYQTCLELLRPGGLLMIDNTLWSGAVADPQVQDEDTLAIRELNKTLHQDKRVSLSLLPIGDGLTLARKRC